MLSILVFLLVIILLIAEGFIFFVIGYATDTYVILKKLQEKGWAIKMPDGEDYNPDFRGKK